jgi:hypothetical protein
MSANSEEDVFQDPAGGASEGDGAGGLPSPEPEPQRPDALSINFERHASRWGECVGGCRQTSSNLYFIIATIMIIIIKAI